MKKIYTTSILALTLSLSMKAQFSATLNPVQDACFMSMGGGQGANTMLKFDISSLPPGAVITSAVLEVYVWDTLGPQSFSPNAKLGNMRFMNLHGHQGWTETDSSKFFIPSQNTFSDTIIQLTGFGDTIGWTISLNLKAIVDEDHLQLNQFCTIFMKDTDDITCCGGPGVFLTDCPDSLITGNKIVGSDQIMFYPHEKANYMPKLIITYTCPINVGVTIAGNTLTANQAGATYQWLDCGNGKLPIGGATNQAYTISSSGNYAVVVSKSGCTDTSACNSVVFTGIAQDHNSAVHVYPNPTKDLITVELSGKEVKVVLYDLVGRVIYSETRSDKKVTIDISAEKAGLYFLKAGAEIFKIIKE